MKRVLLLVAVVICCAGLRAELVLWNHGWFTSRLYNGSEIGTSWTGKLTVVSTETVGGSIKLNMRFDLRGNSMAPGAGSSVGMYGSVQVYDGASLVASHSVGSSSSNPILFTKAFTVVAAPNKVFRIVYLIDQVAGVNVTTYSAPWVSPPVLKKLEWFVTNNTGARVEVGVWPEAMADGPIGVADTMALVGPNGMFLDPGFSGVAYYYVYDTDPRRYTVGFLNAAQSGVVFGGLPVVVKGSYADGSACWFKTGAVRFDPPAPDWKSAVNGVAVNEVVTGATGAAATVTPPAVIPKDPTAVVPDGGTGAATGKEVTDGANGIIKSAHADAKALQSSVDTVGQKIDALGDKLGTGSGSGIEGGNASNLGGAGSGNPGTGDLQNWGGGETQGKLQGLNPLANKTMPSGVAPSLTIPFSSINAQLADKQFNFGEEPLNGWVTIFRGINLFFVSGLFAWQAYRLISRTIGSI